jgi:hypothetical protein
VRAKHAARVLDAQVALEERLEHVGPRAPGRRGGIALLSGEDVRKMSRRSPPAR